MRLLAGGPLARALGGPLRRVALLYVPYYVYAVRTMRGGASHEEFYATDAVTGALDPFLFAGLPVADELVPPRNVVAARLTSAEAAERLRDHLRRMLYQQGFFRSGSIEFAIEFTGRTLLLPYWTGFFGAGEQARVRVVDGLRGTLEGAKVRTAIVQWLGS